MLNPYDQPGTGVKQLISLLERRIQYLQTALESLKKAEGLDGEADRHIEVATPSKPRKTSRSRSEAMKAAWARRRAAERQARSTE